MAKEVSEDRRERRLVVEPWDTLRLPGGALPGTISTRAEPETLGQHLHYNTYSKPGSQPPHSRSSVSEGLLPWAPAERGHSATS